MKTGYVYIIKCADNSYYTGVTNDPERRLAEHQQGIGSQYTKTRRPLELVWVSEEMHILTAIENEKKVKGWRREKKEALINGYWDKLPELSVAYWKKK
jgi:putative endonuclease